MRRFLIICLLYVSYTVCDFITESDQIDILAGLLFFPDETVDYAPRTFDFLAEMYRSRYEDPDNENLFNDRAYQAMQNIILSAYLDDPTTGQPTQADYTASLDKICTGCSILVYESWDQMRTDINQYYMEA